MLKNPRNNHKNKNSGRTLTEIIVILWFES